MNTINEILEVARKEIARDFMKSLGLSPIYSMENLKKLQGKIINMEAAFCPYEILVLCIGFILGETITNTVKVAKWNTDGALDSNDVRVVLTDKKDPNQVLMNVFPFVRAKRFLKNIEYDLYYYARFIVETASDNNKYESLIHKEKGEWHKNGPVEYRNL
ncbi:hypothetical protein [Calidifontibacillus oryziterrae]|uniref:hypothetical protein n=1 Tax=Calidifontibacillus oryziterrae TaxID=1191699 RepID=UPI0002DFC14C|nr:hypothetical protein [Calidifontibacillus oryziterrae]